MKIVLIGYMGSGKSSVGQKLAELLHLPFKDLDEEIQQTQEMSIPAIFSNKGEIYFRKLENTTLKNILAIDRGFVLATGGGTPCYGDSLSAMLSADKTTVVYLKVPLPILCERLMAEKGSRPLLSHLRSRDEMLEFVGIHLFERSHFYNQAGLVIDTGEAQPEQVAQKIMAQLF